MSNILELQKEMRSMPQVEINTIHRFTDGVYSREITIPAGVSLVGAKHLTEHFYVISKGECVFSDNTSQEALSAPYHGTTSPGTKRAIYALTDTIITTFHATNETDINKIESDIIEPEGLKIQNNPKERLE